MKLKTFTILLTFCSITTTFAQKATIRGKISDAGDEKGIPFSNVTIPGTTIGVASDIDGNYELKIDPGTYNLSVTAIGYETVSKSVTVTANQTLTQNFALKKGVELGMFVKTEGKFEKRVEELTVSLEIIKPNIIENKNATSVDQALQQTPGLAIVDGEPQMRGGSGYSFGAGSRVMVLVDDLPLLAGDAGRPSWGFIPIENIEQIEVIKGASSVLYGSAALNGVINIRTAFPGNEPKTKITMFTGVYDNPQREDARWWKENNPTISGVQFLHSQKYGKQKNFDLVLGGNIYSDQGFVGPEPIDPATAETNDDGDITTLNRNSFQNRARINFNTRYRNLKIEGLSYGVNANFMKGRSVSALLWVNDEDGFYRGRPGAVTRTIQTTYTIDPYIVYSLKGGTTHSLRTRVYYLNNDNDNNQGNASYVFFGEYQVQHKFKKIKDFTVTGGIMASQTFGIADLFAGQPPLPEDFGVDTIVKNDVSTRATNIATYLQLDKKFAKRFTLSAGVRGEYFKVGKYDDYSASNIVNGQLVEQQRLLSEDVSDAFKPVFRTGLNFKAAEFTFVRASIGQGFRFPTIAERYIKTFVGPAQIFPNTELQAETSTNFELGIKQGIKIGEFRGFIDLSGFWQEYRNYVEFIAGQWEQPTANNLFGIGFKSVNIGPARVNGVDASLMGQGDLAKDFTLTALLGYTYTNPRSLDPNFVFIEDFVGNPLSNASTSAQGVDSTLLKYRFRHLVRADLEFSYKRISFGVSARYTSFMDNIDRIFEFMDDLNFINGVRSYRERRKNGDWVFDARFGYGLSDKSRLSLVVNNVLNREYALRPLSAEPMRLFILQYNVTF